MGIEYKSSWVLMGNECLRCVREKQRGNNYHSQRRSNQSSPESAHPASCISRINQVAQHCNIIQWTGASELEGFSGLVRWGNTTTPCGRSVYSRYLSSWCDRFLVYTSPRNTQYKERATDGQTSYTVISGFRLAATNTTLTASLSMRRSHFIYSSHIYVLRGNGCKEHSARWTRDYHLWAISTNMWNREHFIALPDSFSAIRYEQNTARSTRGRLHFG